MSAFQDGPERFVTGFKARLTITNGFVPQDGHDYVPEVSVAGHPAVQRREDGAERSSAPETSRGEPRGVTAGRRAGKIGPPVRGLKGC